MEWKDEMMSNILSLIFYISVICISTLLFSVYNNPNCFIRRTGVTLSILIPSVVSGLRYEVGVDYRNYYMAFRKIAKLDWKYINDKSYTGLNAEPVFNVWIKLLTYFFNAKVIFGILTFITLFVLVKAMIKQYGEYRLALCFFVYMCIYYGESLNNVRQFLAVSFVLASYTYIFQNKPVKFLFLAGIAAVIHISALLIIPLWFFWDHKKSCALSVSRVLKYFTVIVVVELTWKPILAILIRKLAFLERFEMYLISENSANGTFYIKLGLLVLFLVGIKYRKEKNERINLLVYAFSIDVLISIIGFSVSPIKRVGLYYGVPSCVILGTLPQYMNLNSVQSKKIAVAFVILFGISYFALYYYILGNAGIMPYKIK